MASVWICVRTSKAAAMIGKMLTAISVTMKHAIYYIIHHCIPAIFTYHPADAYPGHVVINKIEEVL